jgi:cob(I)alamin adenosyltransferase
MVRINRVYTRTGDGGETSLIGGERASKASLRIECYGTVDEVNATLGLVKVALDDSAARAELDSILTRVQNELFNLGAELATPDPERLARMPHIAERHVEALEADIDRLNDGLPDLTSFVLPGGGAVSAHCHLARTVCRRAERLAVELAATESIRNETVRYLNRLSDALFVFGRYAAHTDKCPEPLWDSRST